MNESKVQKFIKKELEAIGFLVLKYSSTGAGEIPGMPDLICIPQSDWGTNTFFLEVKDKGNVPDPRQEIVHQLLKKFAQVEVITGMTEAQDFITTVKWRLRCQL